MRAWRRGKIVVQDGARRKAQQAPRLASANWTRVVVLAGTTVACALLAVAATPPRGGAEVTRGSVRICPGTLDTRPGTRTRGKPPRGVIIVWVVDQNTCLLAVRGVERLQRVDGQVEVSACPVDCGVGGWILGAELPSMTSWAPDPNRIAQLSYEVTITKALYWDFRRRRPFGRCVTTRRFPARFTNPGARNFIRYRCTT